MTTSIDALRPILRAEMSKLRIPVTADKVYKDECVYSFDSPFSDTGLYVNLVTYFGVGLKFLKKDIQRSGSKLYLHLKWTQIEKEVEPSSVEVAPSKLAIGVSGGFLSESKYDIVKENFLVIVEGDQLHSFPLPNADVPEFISNVANAIIAHDGMKTNLQVTVWDADNEKIVSKYAENLQQTNPSGKKISQDPKSWIDEETGVCDNLWLNLSTGYIGGGRKNWDGTGGSGSALNHFQATGCKYPLVVKLGTITPHGADVWSYAPEEDCLVIDPHLAEHLSFWGIDVMKLEKTDKTMGEMEVSLNMSYDWSRIVDGPQKLEPISGAGFVGLTNIGCSCYLNSVMQCILAAPEVAQRYLNGRSHILDTLGNSSDPTGDVLLQLSKVADALLTDTYVPPPAAAAATTAEVTLGEAVNADVSVLEKYVVAPRMFKHIVARGHSEFSGGRQQDASEYFQYLLEVLSKAERVNTLRISPNSNNHSNNNSEARVSLTSSLWEFHVESRCQSVETGEVRYGRTGHQSLSTILELPIPLEKAFLPEEQQEAKDSKRQKTEDSAEEPADAKLLVPFTACLEAFAAPEVVDLFHPALNRNTACTKTSRFTTFPRYLMVKMGRYVAGPNWVSVKINARVNVPEFLDLTHLKGLGLQEGEREIPQEGSVAATASAVTAAASEVLTADEGIVAQLVSMGFSENGSRRAAIATNNTDAEAAMGWVFEHMEDANFNDPPASATVSAAPAAASGGVSVDPEVAMLLQSMGYTEEQTAAALIATNNNVERAADWLFSHVEDLQAAVAEVMGAAAASSSGASVSDSAGSSLESGEGKYELVGVISHIGRNTDHGHYVSHVKKQGKWVLFNDEKVGVCQRPPLDYGFMYMFRRLDGPGTL